ncbi:hypothetical protein [Paenibacillus alvei]|uniref:hypothetical protein n=1 Tax=Paenibacillus alvei TaxID=44250 RepID=UPI00228022D0|nr:hypothetical protein [Paenibacillus alvei]MCY7484125.1 hypothetical protein [Paenibacillus alvei]
MKLHIESRGLSDAFGEFVDVTPSPRASAQNRIYSIPAQADQGIYRGFLYEEGLKLISSMQNSIVR